MSGKERCVSTRRRRGERERRCWFLIINTAEKSDRMGLQEVGKCCTIILLLGVGTGKNLMIR